MRKFAHGSFQPIEESNLSTHPSPNDLWRGIGGHFESFGQALCEFIDNSISNLETNRIDNRLAVVTLTELEDGNVAVSIEDNGSGITDGFPKSDRVSHDLGGGRLEINLDYGMIEKGAYRRYYRANQATSGLEIRFNGRAMGSGLYQEVWSLEVHPQYNAFLAIVNLISPNRDALPKTVTSKTRARDGDYKKDALLAWVRKVLPSPASDELIPELTVEALVHMLAERKKTQIQSSIKKIKEGFKVFSRIKAPVFADLYVSDGKEVLLYKAKKDMADLRDAYHLLLYWDGAVSDGNSPDAGILVAATFSPGIEKVFQIFNEMTDQVGRTYCFMTRTWNEEGISYPKGTGGTDS